MRKDYKDAPDTLTSKKDVGRIAEELHEEMSEALAAGEVDSLAPVVCGGLLRSLQRRVAARPPGQHFKWTMVKRFGEPRVLSYKVMQMSLPGSSAKPGMAQAVVRLKLRQRLEAIDRVETRFFGRKEDGTVEGSAVDRVVTEHVIISKMFSSTKDSDWKLYGFTEPISSFESWSKASEEKLEKLERLQASMGALSNASKPGG